MPSFVNTLPRWYWTVHVLMNSRVPISGLDRRPGPAARSGPPARSARPGGMYPRPPRAARPAGGSQLPPGPVAEHADLHLLEHAVSGLQVLACFAGAVLEAQPLTVEQVRAGELRAGGRRAQAGDRLLIQPLGDGARTEQGPGARRDAESPRGAGRLRERRQPLLRGGCRARVSRSVRRPRPAPASTRFAAPRSSAWLTASSADASASSY